MRSVFTLVELMVVVAIVAVLAAIAIPQFYEMQLKSKFAEVEANTEALQKLTHAYLTQVGFEADGAYWSATCPTGNCPKVPAALPGKAPVPWTTGTYLDTIGFVPDGDVRGQYSILIAGGSPCTWGHVEGRSDIDGDSTPQAKWCCFTDEAFPMGTPVGICSLSGGIGEY